MSDRMEDVRRPPRAPAGRPPMTRPPGRSRRRWVIIGSVAGGWLLLYIITRSMFGATALLFLLAAIGAGFVAALRLLGVTRDHPWIRGAASRPWRDGQEVLQLALRHLAEVFVVTPSGALLAPNSVELRLNERDYDSLAQRMDIGLVADSAAEVYAGEISAHQARLAGYGRPEVSVICDPAVPPGRFVLRQGRPLGAEPVGAGPQSAGPQSPEPQSPEPRAAFRPPQPPSPPPPGQPAAGRRPPGPEPAAGPAARPQASRAAGEWPFAHDGITAAAEVTPAVPVGSLATVAEPVRNPVPMLRLRTGDYVSQTRTSGARAGRGAVELALPDVPTVSREHARFTYSDGQWWIANLGLNGLVLNGSSLAGEHPLHDGDSIQWGQNQDAPQSRVEIG
jgi:FHA domain